MVNQYGQWVPDFLGQQPYQDPMYVRSYSQQNAMRQMPQVQQTQQPLQQIQTQPQIHNGGFIHVHNEMEARNWPIAPGNSVTFKDESAPFIYTKTMGYNQLETPRFERFRLVKEEDTPLAPVSTPEVSPVENKVDMSAYALKTDFDIFREEIESIKKNMEELSTKKAPTRTKKEVEE